MARAAAKKVRRKPSAKITPASQLALPPFVVPVDEPSRRLWLGLLLGALIGFALGALAGSRQGWVEAPHGHGDLPEARYKVKQTEDGGWQLHGAYEGYYPRSTKIMERGEYFLGKRQGPWVEYYESGAVKAKGEYDKGVKTGPWRTFDEEGREIEMKTP